MVCHTKLIACRLVHLRVLCGQVEKCKPSQRDDFETEGAQRCKDGTQICAIDARERDDDAFNCAERFSRTCARAACRHRWSGAQVQATKPHSLQATRCSAREKIECCQRVGAGKAWFAVRVCIRTCACSSVFAQSALNYASKVPTLHG